MFDGDCHDVRGSDFPGGNSFFDGQVGSRTHGLAHGHAGALRAYAGQCHALRGHDPAGNGNP